MSYPPPAGGGYGYPQEGGGYPPQQSPYPGGSQPPYGQQQPPYPGGTQPPYGQQQPPYPGGPPQPTPYGALQSQVTLGFDNLSIQPNQTGGMQMPGQSHSPYPGQSPAPSSYGQPQQPTFGGVAYAAQAAHTFQQAGGYNQPPSGYGAPPQTSYTQQPPSQQYAPYTQPSAPKQPTPPSRPAPPQSTQNYPTSTLTYQSHSTSQTLPQEPPTQGTIRDYSSFDGQQDAAALRKAMKGIGTDEKTITNIIGTRSNAQRQKIKLEFATLYGKDLIKELKSELSGNYESTVLALLMKPDDYDAYCLNAAMEGAGTDEKALIELLCTRTNAQIKASSQAYKRMYKRDLEKELISETSGHFKRLLVSLVQGARLENDPLDRNRAVADAKALYSAGEARWGTDESRFNVILGSRSNAQLRLTFDEYSKISKRTMEKAISSEMSGDLKDGMLAIVKCARNRPAFFAERLHWSMKGLGTNDRALIRIMVSRSEIDMVQIKQEFQNKYNKSLHSYIADDCSGDYKKLLLQICGGR